MKTISELYGVKPPKVAKYKTGIPCLNPDLIIGFELETENCRDSDYYLETCDVNNITITNDGSLRGTAYEFITRPMTSTNALAALQTFFGDTGFDERNYTDRCSVHVHVNCTDMALEQLSTLALLYTTVEEILFDFVGQERADNIYCIPWNHCRAHLDLIFNFLNNTNDTLRRWNKYTALNLLPLSKLGTVEFRLMHGTADMGKLTTWVNIIGSLFKYAKENSLASLTGEIKNLNSSSEYEVFFYRLFNGVLPYTPEYKQLLEEGVIYAKFTMFSMNRKAGAAPVEIPVEAPRPLNMDEILRGIAPPNLAYQAEFNAAFNQVANEMPRVIRRPAVRIRPIPVPIEDDAEDIVEDEPEEGEF